MSTIEVSEKYVTSTRSDNKETRTLSLTSFWCLTVNFKQISPYNGVFNVDLEQVDDGWEDMNNMARHTG